MLLPCKGCPLSRKPSCPTTPFDPNRNYVTSPVPGITPFRLALLRLTFALYALFSLTFSLAWRSIKSGAGGSYFSYFTRLSYIGLCAYFWAAGVQTFLYARERTHRKLSTPSNEYQYGYGYGYPLQRWSRPLQFLHVLLGVTIVTFPILVTIVYWVVLADSSTFDTPFHSWDAISVHVLNTPFALFEVLLTNTPPAPWITLLWSLVTLLLYLGVAYITKADQGFYPYDFLDPHIQHSRLAAWIIGIAIGYCVVFLLVRGIVVLRVRLTTQGVSGLALRRGVRDEERKDEAINEWVAVEIEDQEPKPRAV